MNASSNINFSAEYQKKIITVDKAIAMIASGQTIVAAMAAAEPRAFFERLGERAKALKNLMVYCANPGAPYSCFSDPELAGHLELAVMFLTSAVRGNQGHGCVHYIPQHLSRWVQNLLGDGREIDIFWGSCTLPDKRGFVSLGLNACYEPEILRAAKKVILEVNPKMPITYGATHVPLSQVSHFVEYEHPLPILDSSVVGDDDRKIAAHVAELIPDGATIQLGIGAIPNAIGVALRGKKDLGVHTELINDTIMELYERGVITGMNKTIWPGKIVGAFVYGSERLYDFVRENPGVELQPASVVNDPYRIGRNFKMISVNTAVEIDITGQVCSESIGHRELSGVGGASDTHIGAQRSEGGRGIIAIRSTTDDGKYSKIVFELRPGAKVSISRNDIDTVVTEYGVANLKGKTVAERAKNLITAAHPKFRDELLMKAKKEGYI